ncbi:unnamed protein product [Nezara viridula]|uniref:Uncharacterized protein n=1 Tax=Nezara viridula TaxID=85310 RepID=A0A9P0HQ69_NEZVI|nr:unnamed protein product [Nezara viridula]
MVVGPPGAGYPLECKRDRPGTTYRTPFPGVERLPEVKGYQDHGQSGRNGSPGIFQGKEVSATALFFLQFANRCI